MAAAGPPLAVVLLLATAFALLLAASPASRAAADEQHGGGRMAMVIIRAPDGAPRVAAAPVVVPSNWWHAGWRLEDEVAPEFGAGGGGLLLELGAGQRDISYDALKHADRAACTANCAGKGASYTRPCLAIYQCRG